VTLFERVPVVEYLPGTISVSLGRTPRERWSARLSVPGVEIQAGEVEEISGNGVRLDGQTYEAEAVVAAPGLALDLRRVPDVPGVHAFWDPAGAEAAAVAVGAVESGTVAVVVSSLPYRCPPAPFAMAMELAAYYGNRGVRVVLTIPEEIPLAAVGGGVPEFLARSCAEAGVDLLTGFRPDLASLGERSLQSTSGIEVEFELALVVPPHARSRLLAGLAGEGPLVPVSPRFESSEPGLFVVGDAAMVPVPRAADAAAAEGRTAADAVLERLGLSGEQEPHLPEPECYVGHGGDRYSRISLRYPDGLPPTGSADVTVEGPSESFAAGFEASFDRWRQLRGG
jgi:sulfide:quinone oxidoreductase